MQDRVAANYASDGLPFLNDGGPTLDEQFPLCARLRGMNSKRSPIYGNPMKLTLVRARAAGRVATFTSPHHVIYRVTSGSVSSSHSWKAGGFPGSSRENCVLDSGRFSHFSMTREAVGLAQRKLNDRESSRTYNETVQLVKPCARQYRGRAGATSLQGCLTFTRAARFHVERLRTNCTPMCTLCHESG